MRCVSMSLDAAFARVAFAGTFRCICGSRSKYTDCENKYNGFMFKPMTNVWTSILNNVKKREHLTA